MNNLKPPVLDPKNSKVDGLAFLGLSLTRNSPQGHPDSLTHQTSFDLNEVLDRDYEFIFSTNDDGWLAGGGEPGPPKSYKLAAKDSSHVELMRIGTYRPEWGGVAQQDIIEYVTWATSVLYCFLSLKYFILSIHSKCYKNWKDLDPSHRSCSDFCCGQP